MYIPIPFSENLSSFKALFLQEFTLYDIETPPSFWVHHLYNWNDDEEEEEEEEAIGAL